MGTSTKTPTTVASVAPEFMPKSINATATDNSKKLLAPMNVDGTATNYEEESAQYDNNNNKHKNKAGDDEDEGLLHE